MRYPPTWDYSGSAKIVFTLSTEQDMKQILSDNIPIFIGK